ncbi:MAG: hypothetical protein NZ480_06910, partial [Bdellovibrionaceae bacterium]|nr:hypothetical protein [Pseudobdellovibrionaceae bacterium]
LNDSRFSNLRQRLSYNETLKRMSNLLHRDAQNVFGKIGTLHGALVSAALSEGRTINSQQMSEIANRLVDVAVTQRRHHLVNLEIEDLVALQGQINRENGFERDFHAYLNQYRDNMAAIRSGMEVLRQNIQEEIAARIRGDQLLQKQIDELRDAMGYVAALALTDPLASDEIKRRVVRAANIDQEIRNLIEAINRSGRNNVEEPFTPRIAAIRHVTQGKASCFGTQVSATQLPPGPAFVGGWGIMSGSNIWSDSCMFNFRQGSQHKDNVLYRIWGSAHKIEFRSTMDQNVVRTVDFRDSESTTFPIRRIVDGSFRQGVFDAQVPGILDPAVRHGYVYTAGVISLTPIYVSRTGLETRGASQIYTMTLYSPLVLDFVNKGLPKTLPADSQPVMFDLSNIGFKQQVGWISGQQGALLSIDLNGNGVIDNGSELFGEFTVLKHTGERAQNGFVALAQYDANKDGFIDSKDPIFHKLLLWFDHNADGVSEQGELKTLEDTKVTRISLKYSEVPEDRQWDNGNRIRYQARFYGPSQCGTSGCKTYDIYFGTSWTEKQPKLLTKSH